MRIIRGDDCGVIANRFEISYPILRGVRDFNRIVSKFTVVRATLRAGFVAQRSLSMALMS